MLDFYEKRYYTINDLLKIVKILRSENGCPWDREQDHKSIRNNFIEEVYEAVEAIDASDVELMREELGDVLLQVVFHSQLEEENDSFTFNDVVDEVCKKLIIRHPHVFGNITVSSTNEVLTNWENIKNTVKGTESYTQALTNVPKVLPALMRAQKVEQRAKKAGMDFENIEQTLECLKNEIEELEVALKNGNQDEISEELGDVLFSCVNVSRKADVNAEEALTRSTEKFINRFSKVEKMTRLNGIDMKSLGIDELDVYWQKAKDEFNG